MIIISTIIAAFITVLAASLFKNIQWPSQLKFALATFISVVDAALVAVITHGGFSVLGTMDFVDIITWVFTYSQMIYQFLLSGDKAPLKKVESILSTSIVKPKDDNVTL